MSATADIDRDLRVHLLAGFRAASGASILALPILAQRLIALLAVARAERMTRSRVAGTLWPDASETSAGADLRSAIWRVRVCEPRLLDATRSSVRLSDEVAVDLDDSIAVGRRILTDPKAMLDGDLSPATFDADLLPGWDEEWLDAPRERFRQLRIHALEAMARTSCAAAGSGWRSTQASPQSPRSRCGRALTRA